MLYSRLQAPTPNRLPRRRERTAAHAGKKTPNPINDRSILLSLRVAVLVVEQVGEYPSARGNAGTPSDARRPSSARYSLVEKIAHGRSFPLGLSISSDPRQFATSGGSCVRLRTSTR